MSTPGIHEADVMPDLRPRAGSREFGIYARYIGPRAQETRPTSVYRMYDADRCLLYVGATGHPSSRIGHHSRKPWWRHVVRIDFEHFDAPKDALREESRAIAEEHPLFNVRGRVHPRSPRP